jgi:glutamyl-tRNA synthetase
MAESDKKEHLRLVILAAMEDIRRRFAGLTEWRAAELHAAIEKSAAVHRVSLGQLGQPIRVPVTGGSVSPPIDVMVALVGRERTRQRLDKAVELISARAATA